MKSVIFAVLTLCMANAFSGEISIRLTNKNIAHVSSEPTRECTTSKSAYHQRATHTTVITLQSGEVLNLKSGASEADSCSRVRDTANARGRSITNALNSIVNDDVEALNIQGKAVCKKNIAYVVVDEETRVATNFEIKGIIVKCP